MPNSAVAVTGETHDYAPMGQVADASMALDAFILAYSPWAYWKLNEASGAPQDSSGNARHGSVNLAGAVYSQAAITSRCGPSIRLENARLRFPAPQAHLSSTTGTWTIGGMFLIEAELGAGSAAQTVWGSAFLHQSANGFTTNCDFYVGMARMYGDVLVLKSGGNNGGNMNGFLLNQPSAIFVVGSSIPGVYYTIDVWVNGVRMGQVMRAQASIPAASLFDIGKSMESSSTVFAKFRASNLCCWNGELTHRQIIDITEAMMDKAAYATAYKP